MGYFVSFTFSFLSNYLAMLHWDKSYIFVIFQYIFIITPHHILELGTTVVSLWDDLFIRSIGQVSPIFLGKI